MVVYGRKPHVSSGNYNRCANALKNWKLIWLRMRGRQETLAFEMHGTSSL